MDSIPVNGNPWRDAREVLPPVGVLCETVQELPKPGENTSIHIAHLHFYPYDYQYSDIEYFWSFDGFKVPAVIYWRHLTEQAGIPFLREYFRKR